MKKLMVIIVLLVFSTHIKAEDIDLRDVCKATKENIILEEKGKLKLVSEAPKEDQTEINNLIHAIEQIFESQLKKAKLYHYLDCREELK